MCELQPPKKRGRTPTEGLTGLQILGANAELSPKSKKVSVQITEQGIKWCTATKVVARAAGVTTRGVQLWRKDPKYQAEVIRLLFANRALAKPQAKLTPTEKPLTKKEVVSLFIATRGPIRSPFNGMHYYDWEAYWEHLEENGLAILRSEFC